MGKLKQTFKNTTDQPIFLNLELSTSRYRLNPGEELVLFYDAAEHSNDPLKIELVPGPDGNEMVIWTAEQDMFYADGREASLDFGRV